MPLSAEDAVKLREAAKQRTEELYKDTYDTVKKFTGDSVLAAFAGSMAAQGSLAPLTDLKHGLDLGMKMADQVLGEVFAVITAFRKEMTGTVNETTAEVLNEFLGTEFTGEQVATPEGGEETLAKAYKVGKLVLDRLEHEFSGQEPTPPGRGGKGARTFVGYGVNFAIQNAIIATLGECFPRLQLDNLRELGVEVAQNLGLGRLIRGAIRPLVDNTISKPYARELQARYRADVLSQAEWVKAWLAGRISKESCYAALQHSGLPDEQIDEMIAQHLPRLSETEWEWLTAMGAKPSDSSVLEDKADGLPDEYIVLRQELAKWHRLAPVRTRCLSEVLQQVGQGFLTIQDMRGECERQNLPPDETELWVHAAGLVYERVKKRLSMGEMLFLFEASQVTEEDVRQWARKEGYSDEDAWRLALYFELKAIEASHRTSGGAAARAIHLHKEHVAFMTDLISGWWGRPPTQAELDYWVNLLDTNERTKSDVKTELKMLDASGPAMPAQ
jgi:hypothetical protein